MKRRAPFLCVFWTAAKFFQFMFCLLLMAVALLFYATPTGFTQDSDVKTASLLRSHKQTVVTQTTYLPTILGGGPGGVGIPDNQPPVVDAGEDITVESAPAVIRLDGLAKDDLLPNSALTITWSLISGPEGIVFSNPHTLGTAVTFAQAGIYVLRLTASDGLFTMSDTVTITVAADPIVNRPPEVKAGADMTITLPALAELRAIVSDDGRSGKPLLLQWSHVSGAGGVTFEDAALPETTAAFTQPGIYVLRFTADDGEFINSDEILVTVLPAILVNLPPLVDAGSPLTIMLPITAPAVAQLDATVVDDGVTGVLTTTWSLISGPDIVVFNDLNSVDATATFTATGVYFLHLAVSDGEYTVVDELKVTIIVPPPVNYPPVVNAGEDITITLPAMAQLVAEVADDDLPTERVTLIWHNLDPATLLTFTTPYSESTQVSFARPGAYGIQLTANDGELTGSDNLSVTVLSPPNKVCVFPLGAGTDDAEETTNGTVTLTSGDLDIGSGAGSKIVGLRFNQVTLSAATTVHQAYIQFVADKISTGNAIFVIQGQAVDNAPTFTTASANISTRTATTATVTWAPPTWNVLNEMGVGQRTADLTPILQEIFQRPGWASGNTLVLTIQGDGSRMASSFERDPAVAPQLFVEAASDIQCNQPPLVDAGSDQLIALKDSAILTGTVTDDGLPGTPVTALWQKISGPGSASFAKTTALTTAVKFSQAGAYRLRLTAHDGQLRASDEMTITVSATLGAAVLIAAGDIASCGGKNDDATAKLLDTIDGTVITLGDNVYSDGTDAEFTNCYAPTWGRHKQRTKPTSGNHDYHTPGASGYFKYFGAVAGDPAKGYYSFDLGGWHIISLNSECGEIGGCGASSPQGKWLEADLKAHPTTCTLAYWHKPRFSSGVHGGFSGAGDFWKILYAAGADVVLNGHEHIYERFAPQNPTGKTDSAKGIRQFTVGTGGAGLTVIQTIQPTSEVRQAATHGILKLTLNATGYAWEFVPIAGKTFTDKGSGSCH